MTSRITIEVDFSNGQPYIKCVNDTQSDDVRDKLLKFFREKLGGTSSWCKVEFPDYSMRGDNSIFFIRPVTPEQLKEESEIMKIQALVNNTNPEDDSLTH